MFFQKIKGHRDFLSLLKNQIINDSYDSIYLLTGPKSIGKYSIAKCFSKYILCNSIKDDSCRCNICKIYPNSPDLLEIGLNEDTEIKVSDIESVEEFITLYPFMSKWKVVIIDNSENLNYQATNKLLKIIEDTPKNVIFIFISSDSSGISSILHSRMITYNLETPSIDDLVDILKDLNLNAKKIDEYREVIPYLSRSIIRDNSQYLNYLEYIPGYISKFSKKTEDDLLSEIDSMSDKKELIYFIEIMLLYINDIMKIKNDAQNSILFKDKLGILSNIALEFPEDVCIAIMEKFRKIIIDNNRKLYIKLSPKVKNAISYIYLLLRTELNKKKENNGK